MQRLAAVFCPAFLAFFLCAISVDAQVSTAALNGTVLDSAGAVVPDAKIVVTQTDTHFTTDTNSGPNGSFTFASIPVGPYSIEVTMAGFEKYKQSGIILTVGQTATVQVSLAVGSTAEEVVVTADAPPVDSANATIQHVVSHQAIVDIPLDGRNPATLMYTVPGVNDAALNPSTTEPNSTVKTGANLSAEIAPTTNGVRAGGTYFSLDGADNVDPFNVIGGPFPNPDATQEFGVVTGSYGAQYVSAPGGAVNIVTKSGTNEFHGSLFEFLRNGFFNARNDFSTTPDVLKRNQYGFAVGGP
jgi:Carboxypeptidase regulatory-like domain